MWNDAQSAEVRAKHPDPGATPLDHLRHTLSVFANQPDNFVVLLATSGIYEQPTGLTLGDLRALATQLGL